MQYSPQVHLSSVFTHPCWYVLLSILRGSCTCIDWTQESKIIDSALLNQFLMHEPTIMTLIRELIYMYVCLNDAFKLCTHKRRYLLHKHLKNWISNLLYRKQQGHYIIGVNVSRLRITKAYYFIDRPRFIFKISTLHHIRYFFLGSQLSNRG